MRTPAVRVVLLLLALVAVGASGVYLHPLQLGYAATFLSAAALAVAVGLLLLRRTFSWHIAVFVVLVAAGYFIYRAEVSDAPGFARLDQFLVILGVVVLLASSWMASIPTKWCKTSALWFLGALVVANVGVAFYQTAFDNTYLVWTDQPDINNRASGMFSHQNHFAGLLAGSICYFLAVGLLSEKRAERVPAIVLTLVALSGVVMSESRGGALATLVGIGTVMLLAILWSVLHRREKAGRLVLIAVVGVMVTLVGGHFLIQYLETTRGGQGVTETGFRVSALKLASHFIGDSLLTGHGARSFEAFAAQHWGTVGLSNMPLFPRFVHNEPVQALFDYGLIGAGLLLAVTIWALWRGLSEVLGRENLPIAAVAASGALIAFLTQSLFSFLAHIPALLAFLAVHFGVLLRANEADPREKWPKMQTAFFGLVLAAFAGLLGVKGVALAKADLALKDAGLAPTRFVDALARAGEVTGDPELLNYAARRAMVMFQQVSGEDERQRWFLKTEELYRKLVELDPQGHEGPSGLGVLYEITGEADEAITQLRQAFKMSGSIGLYSGSRATLSRALVRMGLQQRRVEEEKAERWIREGVTLYQPLKGHQWVIFGETPEAKADRRQVAKVGQAWITYRQAERLAKEAAARWSKRRSTEAAALMQEALTRMENVEKIIAPLEFGFPEQKAYLVDNLALLKGAGIVPVELSADEIQKVADGPFYESLAEAGEKG